MRKVYASLYQVLVAILAFIFVMTVMYISNVPKNQIIAIGIFLVLIIVFTVLSYLGKIPLYRIME